MQTPSRPSQPLPQRGVRSIEQCNCAVRRTSRRSLDRRNGLPSAPSRPAVATDHAECESGIGHAAAHSAPQDMDARRKKERKKRTGLARRSSRPFNCDRIRAILDGPQLSAREETER